MTKANEEARRLQAEAEKRVASREKTAQQVPAGWVSGEELDRYYDSQGIVERMKQEYTAIPATLYTDFSGSNLISI